MSVTGVLFNNILNLIETIINIKLAENVTMKLRGQTRNGLLYRPKLDKIVYRIIDVHYLMISNQKNETLKLKKA